MISALQGSNWSQVTFCILTNVLTSIPERFCPIFEQISISPREDAINHEAPIFCHAFKLPDGQIGKVRCGLGFYCYTHSLRRTAR